MAKVSFIVIGYNISVYLERCFNTILNQTLKDIEVIFVNDGSTDDTKEVINKIADKDNRVRVINQKNSGANAARKRGFIDATGEYVLFVDGDDWIELDTAEKLYNIVDKEKYDIVSFGHYFTFDDHKEKAEIKVSGILKDYDYLDNVIISKLSHNIWNKFFNRDFLINANFNSIPNLTMGDDLAANVRLGVCKPKTLIIDEYYYNYYHRSDSVTRQISPKILEIQSTIKDIQNCLKEKNLFERYSGQVDYIKFHEFFIGVVKCRHKDSYIQRKLYSDWKSEKIRIKKNKFCVDYLNSRPFLERLLLYFYLINYNIGYFVSRVYLKIRDK